MSGSAKTFSPRAIRWTLIAAAVLALFGSVAAPAQAGDFYAPDRYDYGPPRYGYAPSRYGYGYHPRCYSCGCWNRCQPRVRYGSVYERRYRYVERKYVEREYVERRYASPVRRYHHYGWQYSDYPRYRTPSSYPWGYGGIREQQPSYGYGRSGYYDAPPRPPAPVGYDAGPYGDDEGRRWDPD
jgi:hypothetical protein